MSQEPPNPAAEAASSEVKYEGFCDAIVSIFRQGVFQVHFGQTQPGKKKIRWIARFWLDPTSYKKFSRIFQMQIESYEKKFGEVKV